MKSKKVALFVLAILALLCSRGLFMLINDPEGPNLLVVLGAAVIIYGLFVAIYLYGKESR